MKGDVVGEANVERFMTEAEPRGVLSTGVRSATVGVVDIDIGRCGTAGVECPGIGRRYGMGTL